MKPIKLRPFNRIKYCEECHEDVEIVMRRTDGYCPICQTRGFQTKLYTIDNRTTNQNRRKK